MAVRLISLAISGLAFAPSRSPMFVPRLYNKKIVSLKTLLTKEEIRSRKKAECRLIDADVDIRSFLRKCEERTANERPLPSRTLWKNRPKWNGKIIGLTHVVGDPPVAPIA